MQRRSIRSVSLALLVVFAPIAGTTGMIASAAAGSTVEVVDGSVVPEQVNESTTVIHDVGVAVNNVSKDGNTDVFYITFPDTVSGANLSANSANVTNRTDGSDISISSSVNQVDGPDNDSVQDTLRFAVSPTSGDTVDVLVNVSVDITWPAVETNTSFPIQAAVNDSSTGSVPLTTVATVTVTTPGQTLVVAPNGSGEYTSIQAAVDNASAGDIVAVTNGTYNETVDINKSLTLAGAPGDASVGPATDAPVLDGGKARKFGIVFTGGPSNVTIAGFEIRNYTTAGIAPSGRMENITIRHNAIHHINGSDLFLGFSYGVRTSQRGMIQEHLVIERNRFRAIGGDAVFLDSIHDATVRNNVIIGTDDVGTKIRNASSAGISVGPTVNQTDITTRDVHIYGNDIRGTFRVAAIGMFPFNLSAEAHARVEDIRLRSNTVTGPNIGAALAINPITANTSVARILASDNAFRSTKYGVVIRAQPGTIQTVQINQNVINDSGATAIRVRSGNASEISLHNSIIMRSGKAGLDNSATGTVNATHNYWGASDGPSGDFNGSGDAVIGNVTVTPFYTDAALTTLSSKIGKIETLIVNKSDPDAYHSIQNAVKNASGGDIINVTSGTYNESVAINKSITLTGDPGDAVPGPEPDAPVLESNWSERAAFDLIDGVSNVTIQGFEIREYTSAGVGTSRMATADVTIRDNYVHDIYGEKWTGGIRTGAVQGDRHRRWEVTDNVLAENGFAGIYLLNIREGTIANNRVHGGRDVGTVTPNASLGIIVEALASSHDSQTSAITIHRNTVIGRYDFAGIELVALNTTNQSTATVSNVTTSGNHVRVTGADGGVWIGGISPTTRLSNITIRNNSVTANTSNAVWMGSIFNNTQIKETRITANDLTASPVGVRFASGTTFQAIMVDGNQIANNSVGVRVNNTISARSIAVHRNRIANNTAYGVLHEGEGRLNATYNYWGSSDGPSGDFNGSGDAVVGNVTVRPFYKDANLTQLSSPPVDPGDANGDGSVTSGDATLVLRRVVGLSVPGSFSDAAADVNDDNSITSGDATLILRIVVGLPI